MITREGAVILLMTFFFFIIASNILVGWLYLLISILISMMLINIIYPLLSLRGLEITRTRVDRCHEEDYSCVKLKIKNTGKYTKYLFKVEDFFPGEKENSFFINSIKAGEEQEFTYNAKAEKRGIYAFPPPRLVSRAPLNIFKAGKKIKEKGEKNLIVFPKLYKIRTAFFKGYGMPLRAMDASIHRAGQSDSFLGVREFRPGDSKRFIHWRSTAKRNKLMLKEFEEVSGTPAVILIDCNKEVITGEGKDSSLEYSLRFAGTMALYMSKKNIPFRIIAFDEEEKTSSSRSPEDHMIYLSKIEGKGKISINESASKILHKIPPGSNLTIFTPDAGLDEKIFSTFGKRPGEIKILYFLKGNLPEIKPAGNELIKKIYYKKGDNPDYVLEYLLRM